jgi:murein DD-endopeptidase MepM/ murein hydrolase activator NlpD
MPRLYRIFTCAVLFLIIISVVYLLNRNKRDGQTEQTEYETENYHEPVLRYGLPADSFILETGIVKPNQHLSNILNNFGVGMSTIDQLAKRSMTVFDVRKIRSGNKFTVFRKPDSLKTACYFIYESSATDYYVFELIDSLNIYHGEKNIQKKLRNACGVIQSSLWNTMKDNDIDPMLAIELSDIFAWTIDFFAIQRGDRFRVIYDELFVDSVYIGTGEIYAVQFDHYGEKNYAFRFYQNDRFDYFDESGLSLRKAFLKAPLKYSRISSRFSYSRLHPILRIRRPHLGVDYAAPRGTPVLSIGDGTVIERAYQKGGGGNYVKIKHNSVYTTLYMHLSGFGRGISPGIRVQQGQVIGYVGSTGLSTGPHLDFRVYKNGKPFDPLKVEAPPVEPVSRENLQSYTQIRDSLLTELQKINWDEMLASKEEDYSPDL